MGPRLGGRVREHGAAAVEFAIILPLILLFIAGIVDFGRAMYHQSILTNAAREGARAAVVGGDPTLRAQAASTGLSYPLEVGPVSACAAGVDITVTVKSQFDWLIIGPAVAMTGGVINLPEKLEASAQMRCGG